MSAPETALLARALKWLEEECRPDAEWTAEGHNWSMSDDDRREGQALMADLRAAIELAKTGAA